MVRSRPSRRAPCAVAALAALLVPAFSCRPPAPPPRAPKLILLIVVDQFRGDYLDRFAPLWSGGLRRLLDRGVVFTDAHQTHAVTHTATGHASLVTGTHPRRHGIIANSWVDPASGRYRYSVADPRHRVSPAQLLTPTLGDWLKERSPRSRVFAISGKDRSAVLLAGHRADAAFWYDDGEWESSSYYLEAEPEWLDEFHDRRLADAYFGTVWEPLEVPAETLAEAGLEPLDLGPLLPGFPHTYGGLAAAPSGSFYRELGDSPAHDDQLTRFAEELIEREELGADGWPDLLALGYSALDAVGHTYGPDSREVLDTLLRLDRRLDELLEFVDRRIGLDNVVVALSSDHGVAPVPELGRGRRVSVADVLCTQGLNRRLSERLGEDRWLLRGSFLNPAALERHGVARRVAEEEIAGALLACPPIRRVWSRSQLADPGAPAEARLFFNSFHAERSPDFLVEFEPYYMPTLSVATNHGGPHPYDTHVPLILLVPGRGAARDPRPAEAVDLAPTLAALAGLEVPDGVDGVDLGPRLPAGGASAGSR